MLSRILDRQLPHITIQEKVGQQERNNTLCPARHPAYFGGTEQQTGGTASDLDQLAGSKHQDSPRSYSIELAYQTESTHKLSRAGQPKVSKASSVI
jgi:hypothetical protein